MCFSSNDAPKVQPLPAPMPIPSPAPIPQKVDVSPQVTEQQRAARISQLKKGILSTIKTAPFGTLGTSPTTGGKKTLGV